jgi:flagellar motor switch protein FliN/FliY
MADETPAPQPDPIQPDPTEADPTAGADFLSPDNAAFETPTEPAQNAGALSDQDAIDELLKQANFDDPNLLAGLAEAAASNNSAAAAMPDGAASMDLPNFQQVMADAQVSSIDLLRDVDLNVKIELGRSRMLVEDVLKLGEGSVVELDKLAGDPVDVFVNDRLVARGEVLVLNDNFCVRVNEIVAGVKEQGD